MTESDVMVIMSPRGFNREETRRITRQLRAAGRELFGRHGVRRTTVDELAKRAGIAKGSFYRFFGSKEELFLAVAEDLERELREEHTIDSPRAGESPRDLVRRQLAAFQRAFTQTPILQRMADPAEIEALLRKLPPERLAAHLQGDDDYLIAVADRWAELKIAADRDPALVAGLLRSLMLLNLRVDLLGSRSSEILALLHEVVAIGLTRESEEEGR